MVVEENDFVLDIGCGPEIIDNLLNLKTILE